MKPLVVVYKKEISEDLIQKLEQKYRVQVFDKLKLKNPDLVHALRDAVGIVGWGGHIGDKLLQIAPRLKAVSTISVGYDHCDIRLLSKHNVALMHTPNVLTDAVADLAMGLILSTARRIVQLDGLMRQGLWVDQIPPALYGVDVFKKTLGIVGMGRIGKAIAERASLGFRMPILYYSRSRHQDVEQSLNAKYLETHELLKSSDIICNVLPATEDTKYFFNKKTFAQMKKNSIFINVGRGATVNENDLVEALDNKHLLAAGLDVFEKEPLPQDSKLLQRSDVVLMPHVASATHETRAAMDVMAVENLMAALNGSFEKNCVNQKDLIANKL